ncbi:unnamed protein product [Bemisia tabaci]|uniref:Uncharacterized protein n=1 Tax=Bemisia tabaci TaxID=7038 RepID=A0A9P0F0K9_BEMTA|nr:unnamed protein product [Bemisia tabaci]
MECARWLRAIRMNGNFKAPVTSAATVGATTIDKANREFVELEIPFNGAPKRPGSPSPLLSPTHSVVSRIGILRACTRCCTRRYQASVRVPRWQHAAAPPT